MNIESIYSEIILEHSKNGQNKGHLPHADVIERGFNPNCGDNIEIELKFAGDLIEEASFTGVGCAISQASTSMMIDLIKGRTKEEALKLVEIFLGMIKKEAKSQEELELLGDAMALEGISNMPARVKCAVLAWHALKNACEKR
jgi:nitrogen fixation NifU-like protein